MSMLNLFWQDGKLINVGISSLTSEDNLAGLDRAAWQTFQENARLQAENAKLKEEKALFFNEIDRLKADNAKLKRLCMECYRFYESIGSVLDGDHIRKAWHGSSTKAEIEQILKE